jgi:PEP-CTERM motif
MRANNFTGILVAAVLATTAQATTISVNGYDEPAGTSATVNVNGTEHAVWAGPFLIGVNGGPTTLDVFCLDFFASIDNHATYSVIVTPPSAALFQTAAQMYSTYVSNMVNATGAAKKLYGAALQLALWEVVIDGFDLGTTNDLATGNFRASTITPFSTDLQNIVTSYLTAALGPVAPGTVIYQSANANIPMQTLIGGGGPEVPEPGTWALLGSGLIGLSLLRRRS